MPPALHDLAWPRRTERLLLRPPVPGDAPALLGMRREFQGVRDSLHRDLGWLDGLGYALLAEEWRSSRALSRPGSA